LHACSPIEIQPYGSVSLHDLSHANTHTNTALPASNWIGAGANHTIMISSSVSLVVCGYNRYGQLGVGTLATLTTPASIEHAPLPCDGSAPSISRRYRSLLSQDDCVVSESSSANSISGNRLKGPSATEIDCVEHVAMLENEIITQVACGRRHSIYLTNLGRVFGFGQNTESQLGCEEPLSLPKPRHIDALSVPVASIACGGNHTMVLTKHGLVYCWGSNSYGQMGSAEVSSARSCFEPVQVQFPFANSQTSRRHTTKSESSTTAHKMTSTSSFSTISSSNIIQIACGGNFSCAVDSNGLLYTWGANNSGQLGIGVRSKGVPTPQLVSLTEGSEATMSLRPVKFVACGGEHIMAVTRDGSVWCWGSNKHRQLGLCTAHPDCVRPVCLSNVDTRLVDPRAIACGWQHSLIVSVDGQLFGAGSNRYGQLGLSTNDHEALKKIKHGSQDKTRSQQIDRMESMVAQIPFFRNSVLSQVVCGYHHSIALSSNNEIFVFGYNKEGALMTNVPNSDPVQLHMPLVSAYLTSLKRSKRRSDVGRRKSRTESPSDVKSMHAGDSLSSGRSKKSGKKSVRKRGKKSARSKRKKKGRSDTGSSYHSFSSFETNFSSFEHQKYAALTKQNDRLTQQNNELLVQLKAQSVQDEMIQQLKQQNNILNNLVQQLQTQLSYHQDGVESRNIFTISTLDKSIDLQGIRRRACNRCDGGECNQYIRPNDSRCAYCQCPATAHSRDNLSQFSSSSNSSDLINLLTPTNSTPKQFENKEDK